MDEIKKAYDEVFDEDGNVRLCGREKCRNLIRLLSDEYLGIYFGDEESGMMQVQNIKKYVAPM